MLLMNLMFVNVRLHPDLVADLGLGELERAGVVAAQAVRGRRALEAVVDRADEKLRFMSTPQLLRAAGSVALPGIVRAVVRQVLAPVGVIQRVDRAVAVDLRDDEDVEVVDELRRLGIGAVVAHEALRGLGAHAGGRDLVAVLLAVEEDADLGLVADLADPQHVLGLRAARDRGGGAQQVAERGDRAGDGMPRGRVGAVLARGHERGGRRVGVDRVDDLRRGARDRAGGAGGEADRDRVAGRR